ncbi:MAG: putative quinol monooxygenase [Gammaproteobacteria bacterium]
MAGHRIPQGSRPYEAKGAGPRRRRRRQTAEPTFIGTSVHRDPEDPTHFVIYEVWRNRENFETVEKKRPYRRAYEESLDRLLDRPRMMTYLVPTWSQGRLPKVAEANQ